MNQVHLAVQQLGEGDALLLGQAALDLLRAAHAVFDEKVVAAALADPVDDHEGEFGPVFEGAAVFVGPGVVQRGEELVQQPAVAAVEQHHVVTRGFENFRAVGEVVGHHVHILLGHAVDVDVLLIGLAVEHAGLHLVDFHRTPGFPAVGVRVPVGPGKGHHAAVVQLLRGQGPAGVDGPGDLRQLGLVFRSDGEGAGVGGGVLPVHRRITQGDHSEAAPGLLGVEVDHRLVGPAIEVHVGHHMRRGKQPVAEGGLFDGDGFEQMGIVWIHRVIPQLPVFLCSRWSCFQTRKGLTAGLEMRGGGEPPRRQNQTRLVAILSRVRGRGSSGWAGCPTAMADTVRKPSGS